MMMAFITTVRSLEDETRNGERNANRNPEWLGDFKKISKIFAVEKFSQLTQIRSWLKSPNQKFSKIRSWLKSL